jgi:hypothetical protein
MSLLAKMSAPASTSAVTQRRALHSGDQRRVAGVVGALDVLAGLEQPAQHVDVIATDRVSEGRFAASPPGAAVGSRSQQHGGLLDAAEPMQRDRLKAQRAADSQ